MNNNNNTYRKYNRYNFIYKIYNVNWQESKFSWVNEIVNNKCLIVGISIFRKIYARLEIFACLKNDQFTITLLEYFAAYYYLYVYYST